MTRLTIIMNEVFNSGKIEYIALEAVVELPTDLGQRG